MAVMSRRIAQVLVLCVFSGYVASSAIPIWEMLSYEEKLGRLLYLFVHIVQRHCKSSQVPDCRKVTTLHGVSNLLNYNEHTLDLLDPYQRDASRLIWQAATKSQYKYPPEKNYDLDPVKSPSDFQMSRSDSFDDGPQRVIVPAPKHFLINKRRYQVP